MTFFKKIIFFIFLFGLSTITLLVVYQNKNKIISLMINTGIYEIYKAHGIFPVKYFYEKISLVNHNPEEIELIINYKTLSRIEKIRKDILNSGSELLVENPWLNIEIKFKNKTLKGKIKLKGQTKYHYGVGQRKNKNYSYRVKITDENNIFGETNFSLMDVKRRGYIYSWIYRKVSFDEGLPEKQMKIINLKINGENYGAYTFDGSFGETFFINNKLKSSPIVHFNTEKSTLYSTYINEYGPEKDEIFFSSLIKSSKLISPNKVDNIDYNYQNLIEIGRNKFESFRQDIIKPSETFDSDKVSKWLALADIFGGWHDTTQGNVRWYLDPYNYLLIPIPDDSHDEDVPLTPIDISSIKFHDVFSRSVFHTFLFKDEMIRKKYFYYLEKFSDVKYLDIFFSKYNDEIQKNVKTIKKSVPFEFDQKVIYENAKNIRTFLNPKDPLIVNLLDYNQNNYKLRFDIANSHTAPIEIVAIKSTKTQKELNIQKIKLKNNEIKKSWVFEGKGFKKKPEFINQSIDLNSNFTLNDSFIFLYKIEGTNKIYETFPILISVNTKPLDQRYIWFESENYDSLKNYYSKEKNLIYIDEKVTIEKNIFLNDTTLYLGPNAQIFLKNNANIFSKSNLIAVGDRDKKIKIYSEKDNSSCLFFDGSKKVSILKNVKFQNLENCKMLNLNWSLTSAITFKDTKVKITDTYFIENNIGDDYLNLINSKFEMKNIKFINTFADALDLDYSEGIINNIECLNCGIGEKNGDGIDISFTSLELFNYKFSNISDKGMSIGEKSNLVAKMIDGRNSYNCIAIKDGSSANINTANLNNCKFDISVYTKKNDLRSKINLKIDNFNSNQKNNFFIEEDSNVLINNIRINNNTKNFFNNYYGK